MAGIEKMTETILADARSEASSIIARAKNDAANEMQTAEKTFDEEIQSNEAALEKELEDFRIRAESARDLSRRRMILEKKQEIIKRIVEKVRLSLHDSDTDTYFGHLYKMFEKYCEPSDGTMHLNSKDIDRMPRDFVDRIGQIAKAKGGSIEVSKEAIDIEDGFVLVYGGTEENCTFRSLIESQKDSLYDEINKTLWRDA